MKSIATCLTFNKEAEEAANFYVSLFEDSEILETTHYGEHELKALERLPEDQRPGPAGAVKTVSFTIKGHEFLALNGGPNFNFSQGISLVAKCENQTEIDILWDKLSAHGGKIQECGWVIDKYGVSWQVWPAILDDIMSERDFERSQRVSSAIYGMKKLNIDVLRNA